MSNNNLFKKYDDQPAPAEPTPVTPAEPTPTPPVTPEGETQPTTSNVALAA